MHTITRRTIILLLLAGLAACQPSDPWTSSNPEFALRAFLSALQLGDLETVSAFLDDDSQRLLERTHQQAVETLGPDGVPTDPLAGLYRVWTPSAAEIQRLEVTERSDAAATVAIVSVFGTRRLVNMKRADGRWTIDLTAGGTDPRPDDVPRP